MSMQHYEERRGENEGWKIFNNDIHFPHGESPTAKMISFFKKRRSNEPVIDLTKQTKKIIDFSIMKDVSWLAYHLDRKLKYTRKWNDYSLAMAGNLQMYVDQCNAGRYKKCILSKQEWAFLQPKK